MVGSGVTEIPTITRRIEFDAGHRLVGHESKCRNLHGHRYVVDITCSAASLDHVGRVIDFAQVKAVVGGWIDKALDHAFIYYDLDPIMSELFFKHSDQKYHAVSFEPTAENLSKYIADSAQQMLTVFGIKVVNVRLYETPNCWADATP